MEREIKRSGWITFLLVVAAIALLCDFVWCLALMLGDSAMFVIFMISAFSSLIILPVFLLNFAGFIMSFFSKDSRRKLLMGLSGVGIGLLILSCFLLIRGGVDVEKLEKNYCMHSSEMEQAIGYALSCLEDGRGLDIEFEDNGRVSLFHIYKDRIWDGAWDPSREIVDSLAAEIGLNREILNGIRERLHKAGCRSIQMIRQEGTYDVATLMFRRDMGSAYYYDIHNVAMTETEMEAIDADDCTRIVYNSRVCFVYGSPAFGDIAFPGKQEYLKGRLGKSSN